MQRYILSAVLLAATSLPLPARSESNLMVSLTGTAPDGRLADRHALCPPPNTTEADVNPGVTWSAGPAGTRSYALLMQDIDVPADFSQIEKPGVVIGSETLRITVDHWVLADIPERTRSIAAGADSKGPVKGGKPLGRTEYGNRGANIYARFFAADADKAGPYGGYDGPCPPRNDEKVHRYVARIFALDIAKLDLAEGFTGEAMLAAMRHHILAEGNATATYSRKVGQ